MHLFASNKSNYNMLVQENKLWPILENSKIQDACKSVFMHLIKSKFLVLYFSRWISYFCPFYIWNYVFGAILIRINDILIVGQSEAIIGRGGSYQGLSPDSHNLWGTMSLAQRSKFHVLLIGPKKWYFWKPSFKRTLGHKRVKFLFGAHGS